MPATAREYGVNVNDPASSIDGTARMLTDLSKKYNGDQYKMLAGYNWGSGNVDRKGIENAPKETRDYNSKVNRLMNPIGSAYASEEQDTSGWIDVTDDPDSQATVKQSLSVDEPDTSGWVDVTDEPEEAEPAQTQQEQTGFMTQMQQQALKTLGHKSQVAGRGIIEGIAGIPDTIYNTANLAGQGVNWAKKKVGMEVNKPWIENLPEQINVTEPYGTALADKLGLNKATENDAILYPVAKATGGFAIPAAGYSKVKTGANMLGTVAKQLPGMMAGQGSSELVKQMGGNEGAQMAANVVGNVAGSYALPATMNIGRATGRAGASVLGTNMEAVAGRALNRAAGVESPYVADILQTGKVPTVKIPIKGYAPTSSEIAGNPGISTVLRNQKMQADNLTDLGNREYQNMAAVKGYAEKAVGDTAKIKNLQAETKALTESALKPMRANNKPVDVSELKKSLDDAIAYHEGNDEIVKHLKTYRNRFDDADTMPFSKVVNIKQSLFEKMHADKFTDPEVASLQRAKSAFEEFNTKAIDKLTEVEPGYRAYATDMGRLMRKIEQGKAAQKVVKKATGLPVVSNAGGEQVELKPIMSGVLNNALKADSITKLNPTQIKRLSIAQEHAGLRGRTQAGSLVGSNTAQNEAVKDSLLNDAIQGMASKKGGITESLGNLAANYTQSDAALKAAGLMHGKALSAILTKAELDPKYAA